MKKTLVLALCLLMSAPVFAESAAPSIAVAFSPHQGATAAVVDFIKSAKKSIRVAAYSFTSPEIAHALMQAHEDGIDVAIVLDKSNETGKYSAATYLANSEVPLRIDHRYSIMHDKYIAVDGVSLETGSFNFTKAAENNNAENVIVIKNNPDVAQAYTANWQSLWDESAPYEGPKQKH